MTSIKHIVLLVLLSLTAMALLGFAVDKQQDRLCTQLDIVFKGNQGLEFVTKGEVREILANKGLPIVGQVLSELPISEIEKDLQSIAYIKAANVYKSIDQQVSIVVEQRSPLFRFVTDKGLSGYVDHDGGYLPLRHGYTPKMIPVTGDLPVKSEMFAQGKVADHPDMNALWQMMHYVNKSSFWTSQLTQIISDNQGELTLIPRVGNHSIIFGSAQGFEKKFERLQAFYDKGVVQTNWNIYESINVKYEDQVVCKKR